MSVLRTRLATGLDRLIAVEGHGEEHQRLGKLFNTLMLISTGIVVALSLVFLLMQPLGLLRASVSWTAAAFPIAFIPLSLFCLARSRRGHVQSMVRLYVWVNLIAIAAAAWLFDGVYSPAWPLFIWTITVAGTLLAPAYALWMTAGVVSYYLLLLLASQSGLYAPLLSFGDAGREFIQMAIVLIMLVSSVGLLTYLNMRSLRDALAKLHDEIEGRKRTEEDLRQSEERFRNVFENARDIVFTMSKDGVFLSLNPAFEEISGWPAQDWVGKNFAPLVPPEDQPWAMGALERTIRGVTVEPFELPVYKKDGERFIGEFIVAPLQQDESAVLLGICRDVTERKRIEEALSESEHRFRTIFDTAPDGIFTLTLEGVLAAVNPAVAQFVGWSAAELVGTPFAIWIHPGDLEPINSAFFDVLSGKSVEVEARVRVKGGGYKVLDFTATPLTMHGNMSGVLGFFRDVSERRRMEAQIRKWNEELEVKVRERTRQLSEAQDELLRKEKLAVLGQVAGSVGHELRNPLGVMSNAVYFLQTVLADADDNVKEYLDIIRNEIAGSERIVSDLLDSVRTKPPQITSVGLAELVAQALGKLALPPTVQVKLDMPETALQLRVDALQMQQVLRNLISNAIEAMPEGGTLQIGAAADPARKTVTISVRDSGVGMTPEQLGKLFQPLYTTKARGIGLGLVVVKNLTEANGGKVEVKSEAGKGTMFSVTVPAASRDEGRER
jgi:PAS domain S-box-containing protein